MSKSPLFVVSLVAALVLGTFAPALIGRSSFSYRDAAHFFHPLFEFIREQWSAGRVPLWNPYENLGMPLVGETTSSVFYPGKLIFALPLDYTLLYNWYVVGHVMLAAASSFWLARRFGTSTLAAGMASIAYAFCGSVLFQYCNVVFLVGAAWLPVALLAADRMLVASSWRAAIGLGAVLALMVAGGDPQMAYNAGLLAVLYAVILWRVRFRGPSEASKVSGSSEPSISAPREALHAGALLAVAALTCFLLAAIQILPAWEAARRSGRAVYDAPRSVWELATTSHDVGGEDRDSDVTRYSGLLGASASGHQQHIYQFNVGPWRAIEYLWPNVSGRQFPVYRRWLDVVPAEGRAWTPSLYMGLLPFVLAVGGFSIRRSADPRVRWMSWMVLLSAVASWGVFGAVWLVREVAGWFGISLNGTVGDEVGGLYWMMTVVLPGYVYFRYPAKLLVVTGLGLAFLASYGWDMVWTHPTHRLRVWLGALLGLSIVGLGVVLVAWPGMSTPLQAIPPDVLFGSFDVDGAWRDIVMAFAQTIVVVGILLVLASSRVRAAAGPVAVAAGLLVTAADLLVAQRWLVPLAPADAWRSEPAVVKRLPPGSDAYRIYRDAPWLPRVWRETSSADRLGRALDWDRATLAPKHHLPFRLAVVEASSTMAPYDCRVFLETARRYNRPPDERGRPDPSILDLLGVRVTLLSSSNGAITADQPFDGNDMATGIRRREAPHAWIAHDVEVMPELRARTPSLVKRRTEEVLYPDGRARDWSKAAVVETDDELPITPCQSTAAESCIVKLASPARVEIEASLSSPGLLVLSDAYDPGWTLAVETAGSKHDAPILRTNRVMRGAMLPAGKHRLVFRYRPATFYWGAATSAVAMLGLVILLSVGAIRGHPSRSEPVSVKGSSGDRHGGPPGAQI